MRAMTRSSSLPLQEAFAVSVPVAADSFGVPSGRDRGVILLLLESLLPVS
jgi:hypothetical protein